MYVCSCRAVTDRRIAEEIRRGARTVDEIGACTGAGTGCGSCRAEIREMLSCAHAEDGRVHLAISACDAIAAE
jgi:bacterioferritin-associated ferredoxin